MFKEIENNLEKFKYNKECCVYDNYKYKNITIKVCRDLFVTTEKIYYCDQYLKLGFVDKKKLTRIRKRLDKLRDKRIKDAIEKEIAE